MRPTWRNWAGNVTASPSRILFPDNEDEVSEIVAQAAQRGLHVRAVGAAHSFSPLCATDGVLLNLDRMTGVVDTDPTRRRFTARAGTLIRALGAPLWDAGLCLTNQGDIDAQRIAGAVSTSTHGSGMRLQSFSAMARGFRVIGADGQPSAITEDEPEQLAAMQTSVGLLGIITEIEIQATERFALAERVEYWTMPEVLERWDEEVAARRHFSFFWMPFRDSHDLIHLECPAGLDMTDRSMVKLYDERPVESIGPRGERAEPTPHGLNRLDRPYRIYPDPDFTGEVVHRELEYMVPFERGKDAFLALRAFVCSGQSEHRYPVEVRFIAADEAYLSPFYERDSVSISICGHATTDWVGFLAEVARVLEPFDPRPHWGKVHYLDKEMLAAKYPRQNDFNGIRRKLDPNGVFMNESLAAHFD